MSWMTWCIGSIGISLAVRFLGSTWILRMILSAPMILVIPGEKAQAGGHPSGGRALRAIGSDSAAGPYRPGATLQQVGMVGRRNGCRRGGAGSQSWPVT
jgi:hypothetical protein